MITKTTQEVEAVFKAQNWSYKLDEHPDAKNSALITGFDLKSGRSLQIFFISNHVENGQDLAIRVFQYLDVPESKAEKAVMACNAANEKFRFAKFVYRDGHVAIEMDMPAETKDVGAVAVELLYRLLDIADTAYPSFEAALA